MPAPQNAFKKALQEKRPQIGLWVGLANPLSAELCAGQGFDWLVIDGEHGPNDIPSILAQLQAVAAYDCHPVVRPPIGETWLIKQVLDTGAQTILVPMIETAEQAQAMVKAVRYPPNGARGVGAALVRASRFNSISDYLKTADGEICLLLQIETKRGLDNLEAIAAVDGVDGVFIGPADLAADLGHLGNPGAADVQHALDDAIGRIVATGKPAGILSADQVLAKHYLKLGATFVAVGSDVGVFSTGLRALRAAFREI